MPHREALAEPHRRESFRLLVSAQDMQMAVEESHAYIRDRFGLSVDEVRRLEEDGLTGDWPPLWCRTALIPCHPEVGKPCFSAVFCNRMEKDQCNSVSVLRRAGAGCRHFIPTTRLAG
jgi:hypothetical protein